MLLFLKKRVFQANAQYFIACVFALVFFVLNMKIGGPTIQGDEGGYLSNAAALAGYWVDAASSYFAGYSLFLLPAFLLGGDPLRVFFFVKLINSILWGAASLVIFYFLRALYPLEEKKNLLGAMSLAMLYPAWVNFSGYAMSENAFVFVFCLSGYAALKAMQKGGGFWLLWGCSVGFLFCIHPKALPVLFAAFLAGFFSARRRKDWVVFGFFVLLLLCIPLLYKFYFEPWLHSGLSTSALSPRLHYPGVDRFLSLFTDVEKLKQIPVRLMGHLLYLGFGSVGIAFLPIFRILTITVEKIRLRHWSFFFEERSLIALYLFLSFLGTLVVSFILFASENAPRLDHWMYGRYIEGVLLPGLAIGCLFFKNQTTTKGIVFSVVLLVCFLFTVNALPGAMRLNISTLAPAVYFFKYLKIVLPVLLCALFCLCFWGANFRFRLIFVSLFFVLTIFINIRLNVRDYYGGGQRWSLYQEIRSSFPVGTCIGLDPEIPISALNLTFYPGYLFYLYDYDIKRMSLTEWLRTCDGPFISFNRSIPSLCSGVLPIAEEKFNGPVAFKKTIGKIPRLNALSVVDDRQLFLVMLVEGWHRMEQDAVWSGREAKLVVPQQLFPVDEGINEVLLTFRIINATEKNPKVVIFAINGTRQEEIITSSSVLTKAFRLPVDVITGTEDLEISILMPGAESPFSMGLSSDTRVLGISLRKIEFLK